MELPPIVEQIGSILREPMRPGERLSIIALEALRFDLAKATADAQQLLYEKRKQMLWPKDAEKGLTELDRMTRLNGDVAILEHNYQFLAKVETLVEARIQLALAYDPAKTKSR